MIHGVFGKLGSGKGLYVMDIIARELVDGFRDIVTNVPVRVAPWVNGQRTPQIGLRAYLLEKLFPLDETEVDIMLKRVLVIEEMDECPDMYLNRRDGETGEWFKMAVTKKDEKGRPERFDMQEIKARRAAPCLVIIDEAWAFYPNNGGYARAPILNFYSRQQRKLRDECYIVTQHPTDCDEMFWKIAQDFHQCRNHGMERMGMFRQPEMFRVIVYGTNPAKGGAIRQYEIYRRLDKKLCQCYDTTAGVGIGGGFAGDAGQKKKGIHLGWAAVGILAIVGGLIAVPHFLGKGASKWIGSTMTPQSPTSWAGLTNTPAPGQAPAAPVPVPASAPAAMMQPPSEVVCTGIVVAGREATVFLSDGRTATGEDVGQITTKTATVFGETFKRARSPALAAALAALPPPVPLSGAGASFVSPVPVPASAPARRVNSVIVGPTIHGIDPGGATSIHGLQTMQRGGGFQQ